MPETSAPVDVVVVGAGAAGGAAAWRLAAAGLRVVCLEQGGWPEEPLETPHHELAWELRRQTTHNASPNVRGRPEDYPVDADASPITPLMYNAVGGSTVHWGGHFPRLRPSDFRVRTTDGVADDWPLGYDDLEPYYELNDHVMGVCGLSGDPGNPPRGPRQAPPLPLGRGGQRLAGAFDRLGWHWWPVDAAILTRAYDGRGACNHCGPCDLGCPTGARGSTDVAYWPKALRRGVDLRTGCRVTRVATDGHGRATGVDYLDLDGRPHHLPAGVVVLAANGIGTARLLLLSGLANRSDQVGRNLMHHPTGMVTGVFDEPLHGFSGPFAVSLLCQEFYESDPSRGFARGFQMQCVRSDGPLGTALGGYLPRVPWGAGHHAAFDAWFGRTASLTVTTEDLPEPHNRVTLSDRLVDGSGLPAPRVAYAVAENAWRILDWGAQRAREALAEAGARGSLHQRLVGFAGFHLLGTARMGADRETSVVDADCVAHDVENLLVVDGSVFVTCGALNPTSTLQAIALRAADRLVARAREVRVA